MTGLLNQKENVSHLPSDRFRDVVDAAPLVSIDLVVARCGMVLLGKRLNRPAQGFWFVPGGRIRKGETLQNAFQRLTLNELGVELEYASVRSLGIFEHFYDDSVFGESPSTHYVAIGCLVQLEQPLDGLPKEQHDSYRWWKMEEALASPEIHPNTKDYFRALSSFMNLA